MYKSGKLRPTQSSGIDRGVSDQKAAALEEKQKNDKTGVLKSPGGTRFVEVLKANPELAEKYADSKLMDPAQFLKNEIEKKQGNAINLRVLEIEIAELNKHWKVQQEAIEEYYGILNEYQQAISDFVNAEGEFEDLKNLGSKIKELGDTLNKQFQYLATSIKRNIGEFILRLETVINELNEKLKTREDAELSVKIGIIINKLEEAVKELQDFSSVLGVEVNKDEKLYEFGSDSLESRWSRLELISVEQRTRPDVTYEEIMQGMNVTKIDERLVETAKVLKELNGTLLAKGYVINPGSQKELSLQIQEQIAVVVDHCWKVALWKAIMDIFEVICERISKIIKIFT